jgi:ubiquinone biosynthesis accessory factor UbiJ
MRPDPTQLTSSFANRVLTREPWVRDKLMVHAGRTFAVRVGLMENRFVVAADGTLDSTQSAGATPDLRLSIAARNVPSFLADPTRWSEFVREEGDAALGATLRELAATLPWFVEQSFERMFGAVAGQRLADAGRRLLGFPEYATHRLVDNVAHYARHETNVFVHREEIATFASDVEALSLRATRLAERVASLETRSAPLNAA